MSNAKVLKKTVLKEYLDTLARIGELYIEEGKSDMELPDFIDHLNNVVRQLMEKEKLSVSKNHSILLN